ncbi:phage protein GemA/Gp16 family protein [Rhizobium leguminosarum]|uniref:phage protein GemA/Gp16 family protein n=1 Tax=Rhizobium leguminosarum TaxID=384 RepID=UPI003F995A0F
MSASIAAIHVAKRRVGLDEDTYRSKLTLIAGKQSAKDMAEEERQKVLTDFRNDGFAADPAAHRGDGRQELSGKFAQKLQALWIAAWNLGIVRDRDDKALVAFVKRQTGIDHTRFLVYQDDAKRAIEALKGYSRGRVDWSHSSNLPDYMLKDGYRVARVQYAIINSAGEADFWDQATIIVQCDRSYRDLQGISGCA